MQCMGLDIVRIITSPTSSTDLNRLGTASRMVTDCKVLPVEGVGLLAGMTLIVEKSVLM